MAGSEKLPAQQGEKKSVALDTISLNAWSKPGSGLLQFSSASEKDREDGMMEEAQSSVNPSTADEKQKGRERTCVQVLHLPPTNHVTAQEKQT